MQEDFWEDREDQAERKHLVLIIYDISDNKQRLKMVHYLESYGFRVQKSAFEAKLNKAKFQKFLRGLEAFILPQDDVRVYRLKGSSQTYTFGSKRDWSEEDVVIF